eukprot:1147214-Pelagomonas_calceolata.AAC.3
MGLGPAACTVCRPPPAFPPEGQLALDMIYQGPFVYSVQWGLARQHARDAGVMHGIRVVRGHV